MEPFYPDKAKKQCFANKVPCGFTPFKENVAAGEAITFDTMMGFAGSEEQITRFLTNAQLLNKFDISLNSPLEIPNVIILFYTNRGQGMNSFGVDNKGNAIMEFNSANTAFENTAVKGFRTFLKIDGEYYEPFFRYEKEAKRQIRMNKNSFKIIETNEKYGIEVTVHQQDLVKSLKKPAFYHNHQLQMSVLQVYNSP